MVGGRTTFGKSETLCYKVVVDKGKHTSRKQVNGNIAIVGVSRTVAEGSCGEAMCRDMGKSGGEDSGFHGGKWRRGFILIRVIGTAASLGKTLVLSVRTHIPKCAQYLGRLKFHGRLGEIGYLLNGLGKFSGPPLLSSPNSK